MLHHIKQFSTKKYRAVGFILTLILLTSCVHKARLGTYQKSIPIPDYSWSYDFQPSFSVEITDTAARYTISVTVRHTNEYPFSNLWLQVSSNYSGVKPKTRRVELPLADKQGKWIGTGMDDIFEHRIPIQQNARFNKTGVYHFSFKQDMRMNPLPHVMGIGLRIEKETH